jgi:hypothetical protein
MITNISTSEGWQIFAVCVSFPFLPSWLLLQVTNLRHDLENMMEDLDKWPHLISENRQSCDLLVQSA